MITYDILGNLNIKMDNNVFYFDNKAKKFKLYMLENSVELYQFMGKIDFLFYIQSKNAVIANDELNIKLNNNYDVYKCINDIVMVSR